MAINLKSLLIAGALAYVMGLVVFFQTPLHFYAKITMAYFFPACMFGWYVLDKYLPNLSNPQVDFSMPLWFGFLFFKLIIAYMVGSVATPIIVVLAVINSRNKKDVS